MAKDEAAPKMKRKAYEKELRKLQEQLCHLQEWVKAEKAKVIIIFEGRDAAGKGGTIKALTEKVSPRVFRVCALPAPSDRQKSQLFLQRYIEYFPAGGEIVIFDRSWYNRAGVEYVMGFCSREEHKRFLELTPQIEQFAVDAGIILIKLWLEASMEEQEIRFQARIDDPLRQWKLSPMDTESFNRWYDYSRARDMMFEATDTKYAPWRLVRSNDKRKARLNVISHILKTIPYKKVKREKVKLPKRTHKGRYDDQASLQRDEVRRGAVLAPTKNEHGAEPHKGGSRRVPHCIVMVTPPTAAEASRPTLGPLSCRMTPLAFCNCTPPAPAASAPPAPPAA